MKAAFGTPAGLLQKYQNQYCVPWADCKGMRRRMVSLLLLVAFGFGWLAFRSVHWIFVPAVLSTIACLLLISLLLFDSIAFFYYFFGFSRRKSLYLIRQVNSGFDAIVRRLEDMVRTIPNEQMKMVVKSEVNGVIDDYVTQRPLRLILRLLLGRTAGNLLLTIAAFSIISGNIILLNSRGGGDGRPYQHDCHLSGTSYFSLFLHAFYYHSVVFQSLGDGNHAPVTLSAQALATGEAYTAMIYLALLLGGGLGVATFVESAVTEDVIRNELDRALLKIWSGRFPIEGEEDPRI